MSIIFILFAVFATVVIVSSIGRRTARAGGIAAGKASCSRLRRRLWRMTWPAVIIIIIAVRATSIRDAPPIQAVGAAGLTAAEAAGVEETMAAAVAAAVVEIPEAAAAVAAAEIDGRKGR